MTPLHNGDLAVSFFGSRIGQVMILNPDTASIKTHIDFQGDSSSTWSDISGVRDIATTETSDFYVLGYVYNHRNVLLKFSEEGTLLSSVR